MPTYGNTLEPGITTDIKSAYNVSTSGDAPSDLGIVGQADLSNGSANPNELHEITRASQARNLFGEETESLLTAGIIDALREGAFPVFAVATEEIDVTDEDLSGLSSNSGTLTEGPVTEAASDITFSINSTPLETVVTYEDPSTKTPGTDEVYVNPVNSTFEIDSNTTVGNTGDSVDYSYFAYETAIEAMRSQGAEDIDFLTAVNERASVCTKIKTTAEAMDDNYNFAIALVAPDDVTIDPSSFTQPYNTSRVQTVYGTRFEDNTSMLAAYAGQRAALGLDRPAINIKLENTKRMASYQADDVDLTGRSNLIDERAVPLADEAGGARAVDGPTTVDPNGTENDRNIDYGFTRLLIDYVTETVRLNERPFIGRLNNAGVRNAFRDLVQSELTVLQNSGSVVNYTLSVQKVDSTTASLDLSVEVAKPLRFIQNEVTVGEAA